jgi:hypothetical protein
LASLSGVAASTRNQNGIADLDLYRGSAVVPHV